MASGRASRTQSCLDIINPTFQPIETVGHAASVDRIVRDVDSFVLRNEPVGFVATGEE
jgi:hypothetical protein